MNQRSKGSILVLSKLSQIHPQTKATGPELNSVYHSRHSVEAIAGGPTAIRVIHFRGRYILTDTGFGVSKRAPLSSEVASVFL